MSFHPSKSSASFGGSSLLRKQPARLLEAAKRLNFRITQSRSVRLGLRVTSQRLIPSLRAFTGEQRGRTKYFEDLRWDDVVLLRHGDVPLCDRWVANA